jgi:copper chaperone CopZ
MKKRLILILMAFVMVAAAKAQFTKASLQATGLTCAMCSNAINKALQKVPFVESVKSDIKNSSFAIVFKTGMPVNIDALKEAVEGAGFSVGNLYLTGNFDNLPVEADKHIRIGDLVFHFLNIQPQSLNGERTIQVVDKNFVTVKQFKKVCTYTKMSCIQTGKAADCCPADALQTDARVYHVTI